VPARPSLAAGRRIERAFRGAIVHSRGLGKLECLEDGLLTVGPNGYIIELVNLACCDGAAARVAAVKDVLTVLGPTELMCPGFIDGHAHAPQ